MEILNLIIHWKNILGKGMDCHMLALKQIAMENGFGLPDLFQDDSYAISNHFALSTSQVSFFILFAY